MNVDILILISAIMTIASIVFSIKWKGAKKLLKEVVDLMVVVSKAIEDDELTADELKAIIDEATDIADVIKVLKS